MMEPTYSMQVVTRMTGLSADTIRKWESRHQAIHPDRSEGNTRRFSRGDVHRLNLLRELTEKGHRIGDLSELDDTQLQDMIREREALHAPLPRSMTPGEALRLEYIEAVRDYDSRRSRDVLSRAVASLDFEQLAHRFLLPVLRETGDRWQNGQMSVGQEHFLTSQLRGLLTTVLAMTPVSRKGRKVVISTPSGHQHEMGAMVAAVLVASHGFEPIYLGPDLPAEDMIQAVREAGAEILMLSVIRDVDASERRRLAQTLRTLSRQVTTWVGLPEGHSLSRAKTGTRLFHRYEDMELALEGS